MRWKLVFGDGNPSGCGFYSLSCIECFSLLWEFVDEIVGSFLYITRCWEVVVLEERCLGISVCVYMCMS
jgi:hypothetical protein